MVNENKLILNMLTFTENKKKRVEKADGKSDHKV